MTHLNKRFDLEVRWLSAWLALLFLMPCAWAQAVSTKINGVQVGASALWPGGIDRGYQPIEIRLSNAAPTETRVQLLLRKGFRDSTIVQQTVELGGLEQRVLQVDVPTFDSQGPRSWGAGYRLSVSSGGLKHEMHGVSGQGVKHWSGIGAMWFSRSSLEAGQAEVLASKLSFASDEPSQTVDSSKLALVGDAVFAQLPTRARAYSGLNAVILDIDSGLPPDEALSAVLGYARLGGTLVILGRDAVERCRNHELLEPLMEPRFAQNTSNSYSTEDFRRGYRLGHGALFIGGNPSSAFENGGESENLRSLIWESRGLVPGPGARVVPLLRIPGLEEMPIGSFVGILILFAILIGPVNFMLVRRTGKQVLLLLTIPGISLLVSILLLGYGILSQGLDTKVGSVSLSVLDQRSGTLDVVENRHCFIGLGTGGGLLPMAGTSCYPVVTSPEQFNPSIRYGQETLLAGDFYASREELRQIFLSERSSRLRLIVERSQSGFRVTNGLTCGLSELLLRDTNGEAWGCEERLGPGETVELISLTSESLVDRRESEFMASFGKTSLGNSGALVPGAYFAVLDEALFRDSCNLVLNERAGNHGLIGILDEETVR